MFFDTANSSFSASFQASLLSFSGISRVYPKSRKAKQGSVPSGFERPIPEKLCLIFMGSEKKGFIPDEEAIIMGKNKKCDRVPPRASKLPDALREFLDRCVIPSLVEKYFAKKGESR